MKKALWLVFLLLPVVGNAQDGRAVRLSYVQGDVTVGSEQLPVNSPLLEGMRLTTGADGQAEVEFEDGSVVRITPNSGFSLDRLTADDHGFKTEMTLSSGQAYFELRAADRYQYRVTAAGELMLPVANATVRVNLDAGSPVFSVLDGRVEVENGAEWKTDLGSGESLSVDAGDAKRYFLQKTVNEDSWDRWNEERDQLAANEAATRTAARDDYAGTRGDGWSDLDANGSWYDTSAGRVWQPAVANDYGFDPYGYGNWVYYNGVGYVWVSGYGWGWTPYRCGYWDWWDGFGWGWSPAGCSNWGWGGGYYVNVRRWPYGHNPLRTPLGNPIKGPVGVHPIAHPIIPVHPGSVPVAGPGKAGPIHGIGGQTPIFAGKPVHPLQPIGGYAPHGGSAVGAGLRRDYPLNGAKEPMLGRVIDAPPARVRRGYAEPARVNPAHVGDVPRPQRPVMQEPVQNHPTYRAPERPAQSQPSAPRYAPPPPQEHHAPPAAAPSAPAVHAPAAAPAPSTPSHADAVKK